MNTLDPRDANQPSMHADLAFLRALAEGDGGRAQHATGAAFIAGGGLYGLQCIVFSAHAFGLIHLGDLFSAVFSFAITAAFLLALTWVLMRDRARPSAGVAARALTAAFGGAGAATVAMLCIFGYMAWREQSLTIWFLYPCTVFALQGAAWMVAFSLRRKRWIGMVAAGWLVSSVLLALSIGSPAYPLVAGIALLGLMALPGVLMLRDASH